MRIKDPSREELTKEKFIENLVACGWRKDEAEKEWNWRADMEENPPIMTTHNEGLS